MTAKPSKLRPFRFGLLACMSVLALSALLTNGYDKVLGVERFHDTLGQLGWLALLLTIPFVIVIIIKDRGWWKALAIIMLFVYLLIGFAYIFAHGIGQLNY